MKTTGWFKPDIPENPILIPIPTLSGGAVVIISLCFAQYRDTFSLHAHTHTHSLLTFIRGHTLIMELWSEPESVQGAKSPQRYTGSQAVSLCWKLYLLFMALTEGLVLRWPYWTLMGFNVFGTLMGKSSFVLMLTDAWSMFEPEDFRRLLIRMDWPLTRPLDLH